MLACSSSPILQCAVLLIDNFFRSQQCSVLIDLHSYMKSDTKIRQKYIYIYIYIYIYVETKRVLVQ